MEVWSSLLPTRACQRPKASRVTSMLGRHGDPAIALNRLPSALKFPQCSEASRGVPAKLGDEDAQALEETVQRIYGVGIDELGEEWEEHFAG